MKIKERLNKIRKKNNKEIRKDSNTKLKYKDQ